MCSKIHEIQGQTIDEVSISVSDSWQADVAFGRKNGCQEPPELPNHWPFGVDRIKELWNANADGRLLAFITSVARDYEPRNNLSQFLLLGPRAFHILHPKNVEALLSADFKSEYRRTSKQRDHGVLN